MSKNFIGLDQGELKPVISELNIYLSNLNILYTKVHNLHWNIEGASFFQLHSKFEEFYDGIAKDLDTVAERILILGGRPAASAKEYLSLATITELDSVGISSMDAIDVLQGDFYTMIDHSRSIISLADVANDEGTIDMLVDFISNYEKALWMIHAYKAK